MLSSVLPIIAVAILCVWAAHCSTAHESASEPTLAPEQPVNFLCLDTTTEVTPEFPLCPDKTMEVIPEFSVCPDLTMEVIAKVPVLPDVTAKVTP